MGRLSAQLVRIGGIEDGDGRLIFADEALVAVLVRLSALHGAESGRWYLEAGFGRLAERRPPTFIDLDAAQAWISRRLPQKGLGGAS